VHPSNLCILDAYCRETPDGGMVAKTLFDFTDLNHAQACLSVQVVQAQRISLQKFSVMRDQPKFCTLNSNLDSLP
jgi:hypothetical protein